jgi:predicted DNA-binding antitoxin AbrB/MazE fold protein
MTTTVTATFENGVLRPDETLALEEQARVRVTVEPLADEWTPEKGRAAWEALKKLMQEQPLHLGGERFSREELYDRG